ncbi:hypothetical protein [Luteibacter sp. SG786]|uniref:hypothetical protein n=1 Tax=Luteibacter sp. SG786 TaxID=2587130 RepID=UPI00141FCC53|nr:hypothetical protein [Luteibacter sp. SG786]NII53787.1 hypothetical protein [Luteibacter sp. SG786]
MNKRSIARLLRQQVDGLAQSGGYFFRKDCDLVLHGVLLEDRPQGIYLWQFRFPLFDAFGENLLYSSRLEDGGFIAKGELSDEQVVERVLARPELAEALRPGPPMTLHSFLHYLEGSEAMLNPHAHLVLASGLVLAQEFTRAQETLKAMFREMLARLGKRDEELGRSLLGRLREDPDAAVALLKEVVERNRQAFGIA